MNTKSTCSIPNSEIGKNCSTGGLFRGSLVLIARYQCRDLSVSLLNSLLQRNEIIYKRKIESFISQSPFLKKDNDSYYCTNCSHKHENACSWPKFVCLYTFPSKRFAIMERANISVKILEILSRYKSCKTVRATARQFSTAKSIIRPAQIWVWKKQKPILNRKANENPHVYTIYSGSSNKNEELGKCFYD